LPKVWLLIRSLLLLLSFLLLLRGSPVFPQTLSNENAFGASETLFATLAAINAVGYDAGLDSPSAYPIRKQVRDEIAKKSIPSLVDLKEFYRNHRKGTDLAILSQYISFALLAGPAPDFKIDMDDVPPDVDPIADFSSILSRFYKEADVHNLWLRSQQAYGAAIQNYQEPVVNALLEANGYTRNPTSGAAGRRFQIYLSLLAAPNIVEMRNYRADYYLVVTPSQQPLTNEVGEAYLSYLLDPLSLRFSKMLDTKRELAKYADGAPALDDAYKNEFSLLVTKSLIKAIVARMMHGAEQRQAYVDGAMREGYILTAAFAELLPAYEKQPVAMKLYYPDLINGIDVSKERKRLKDVQFAQKATSPVVTAPPTVKQVSEAQQSLEQAQALLAQHDLTNSKRLFERSLEQSENKKMHAEAYFGLAQAAVEERKAAQAAALFQKAIDLNSDAGIVAWSQVYLGRLAMLREDKDSATDHFKRAMTIDGAPERAKEAAQTDLQKISGEKEE
jgi:tetratricopeptide (TPR) repeat protein